MPKTTTVENYIQSHAYFNLLNEMRQTGKLCDFAIEVPGTVFYLHKVVLSTWSPYFERLFDQKSKSSNNKIYFHEISPEILQIVIDYFYTDKLFLTIENIMAIILVAQKFEVHSLIRFCCQEIINNISASSCITALNISYVANDVYLYDTVMRYIAKHFPAISMRQNFRSLSVELLIAILTDQDLKVSVDDIKNGISNWIKEDCMEREFYLTEILKYVNRSGLENAIKISDFDFLAVMLLTN